MPTKQPGESPDAALAERVADQSRPPYCDRCEHWHFPGPCVEQPVSEMAQLRGRLEAAEARATQAEADQAQVTILRHWLTDHEACLGEGPEWHPVAVALRWLEGHRSRIDALEEERLRWRESNDALTAKVAEVEAASDAAAALDSLKIGRLEAERDALRATLREREGEVARLCAHFEACSECYDCVCAVEGEVLLTNTATLAREHDSALVREARRAGRVRMWMEARNIVVNSLSLEAALRALDALPDDPPVKG